MSPVGGRSSMVEPQIVVLDVAGSSPVDHPISSTLFFLCDWRRGATLALTAAFLLLETQTHLLQTLLHKRFCDASFKRSLELISQIHERWGERPREPFFVRTGSGSSGASPHPNPFMRWFLLTQWTL